MSVINQVLKRFIDILVAGILIVILLPVFMIVALIVKMDSKGPVLFIQERAGLKGRTFKILKFRTMYADSDASKSVEFGDSRITNSGHYLREWSLDELPQLINVIKGDMSLVGPRPLLPEYVGRYTPGQRKRLDCKPGITGYQQVMCRYDTPWEKKFVYDVYYVKNFNICFDFWILVKTIKIVLVRPPTAMDGGTNYAFVKKDRNSKLED